MAGADVCYYCYIRLNELKHAQDNLDELKEAPNKKLGIRVNIDVGQGFVSRFGITDLDEAFRIAGDRIVGIHCHIGSQIFETEPFCGNEYRSNELCAAVIRMQLEKLDDILAEIRSAKNENELKTAWNKHKDKDKHYNNKIKAVVNEMGDKLGLTKK